MMCIETEERDVLRACSFLNVSKKPGEHPFPPPCLLHEHTLDPPDRFVAPVTPFDRDHELSDDGTLLLSDEIKSFRLVSNELFDSCVDCSWVKPHMFAFLRKQYILRSDRSYIILSCSSYLHMSPYE